MTGEQTGGATSEAIDMHYEEPNNILLKAIQRQLNRFDTDVVEASLGNATLRLVQDNEKHPARYEYCYRLNTEEHIYINSYSVEKARWWLRGLERPQAESIPLHLRQRVDARWRTTRSSFADPQMTPPYPYEDRMLDYLSSLAWIPAHNTPPPFPGK